MKVYIPSRVTHLLQASSAEVHPHETQGLLLGHAEGREVWIETIYTYQRKIHANDRTWVEVEAEEEVRVADFFDGDEIIGDFHSHPDSTPAISKQDKGNLLDEGDGFVTLILSVWPSPRGPGWGYKTLAYYNDNGRVRRARMIKERM